MLLDGKGSIEGKHLQANDFSGEASSLRRLNLLNQETALQERGQEECEQVGVRSPGSSGAAGMMSTRDQFMQNCWG